MARDSVTQLEIRNAEHKLLQSEISRLARVMRAGQALADATEPLCALHPELRSPLEAFRVALSARS